MIDHKKLALIHIVKDELNLSDQEYRGILFKFAGVRSSKDLNNIKFKRLMNYFVRSEHYRVNPHGLTIRQKLYVKSLAQKLEWTDEHLKNFICKYYHRDEVDKLTRKEAIKLIESLKKVTVHQRKHMQNNFSMKLK